ncbi:MAG: ABC transporter ATP-binding protein [Eubacteriales bacterium]|jgi:branched-chain amino acid transport system ATP-binding protein|nr:ABC transporter ATP-binding protein [Bacillota bacterium]MBV1727326.1 ABC transporter ATP-binding protein [Desulforudis sp.]MDP3049845.1 ABC transporter ATP-binding protein [Eubacteriales bacterium]MDQ7790302.1 ABC transporter ATP-binding protein [Clostridia bacterium]MBU4533457.1 ABC transporter ATP-binding protein [Bacillota bacterium]
MLTVRNISVYYGAINAVQDISFEVKEGEVVTLIGANGAGKSTSLRTISSLIKAKSGEITFEDKNITTLKPHQIVAMGLIHVPEGRKIIGSFTVRDNLKMGAFLRKDKAGILESMEEVFTRFPRLKEREKQLGGTLSGGEQQMLAIGRGLMAKPRLLLLDEPSMGLSPILTEEIFEIIRTINQKGTTILLVEQNAYMALQVAHRAYVLETGRVVMSGDSNVLKDDKRIRAAYLGEIA